MTSDGNTIKGSSIKYEQLKAGLKRTDLGSDEKLLSIFDKFNTNNEGDSRGVLDKDEMKALKDAMRDADTNKNKVVDTDKISKFFGAVFGDNSPEAKELKEGDFNNFMYELSKVTETENPDEYSTRENAQKRREADEHSQKAEFAKEAADGKIVRTATNIVTENPIDINSIKIKGSVTHDEAGNAVSIKQETMDAVGISLAKEITDVNLNGSGISYVDEVLKLVKGEMLSLLKAREAYINAQQEYTNLVKNLNKMSKVGQLKEKDKEEQILTKIAVSLTNIETHSKNIKTLFAKTGIQVESGFTSKSKSDDNLAAIETYVTETATKFLNIMGKDMPKIMDESGNVTDKPDLENIEKAISEFTSVLPEPKDDIASYKSLLAGLEKSQISSDAEENSSGTSQRTVLQELKDNVETYINSSQDAEEAAKSAKKRRGEGKRGLRKDKVAQNKSAKEAMKAEVQQAQDILTSEKETMNNGMATAFSPDYVQAASSKYVDYKFNVEAVEKIKTEQEYLKYQTAPDMTEAEEMLKGINAYDETPDNDIKANVLTMIELLDETEVKTLLGDNHDVQELKDFVERATKDGAPDVLKNAFNELFIKLATYQKGHMTKILIKQKSVKIVLNTEMKTVPNWFLIL